MRRRLSTYAPATTDTRPSMLAVIALLFLLLPFLLLTTSIQRLAGLELGLAKSGELGPTAAGTVESVDVYIDGDTLIVRAAVRTTDVTANEGDTRLLETQLEPTADGIDLAGLQTTLRRFKGLDEEQERAVLHPTPDTDTARIVALLDATRSDANGPLFREVVLQAISLSHTPTPGEGS